jgi:hypothetical protein
MSRKIDNILNSWENRGLTSDGRAWLVAACDPFHDQDLTMAGYPDLQSASSVVQLVKKQLQVTVPSTVTVGSNWDCNISMFPNLVRTTNLSLSGVTPISGTGFAGASAVGPYYFGGVTVSAVPQGTETYPTQALPASLAAQWSGLDLKDYIKGNMRVIGMAFEVVNTTAELYRQGQVTAYRMPESTNLGSYFTLFATTPNVSTADLAIYKRLPPANLAAAQLLYGSRSWAAKEGAYSVARQNTLSNPFVQPTYMRRFYTDQDPSNGSAGLWWANSIPGNSIGDGADLDLPYDLSGAYFTGLSYQTTLTLNVRWLIERCPGPSEADLVVLATPSAKYDPIAFELYCAAIADMPPGVMLSENPLGEWFRKAMAGIAEYAPKVGRVLNLVIPGAGAAGEIVGTIATAARKATPNQKGSTARQPLPGSSSTTNKGKC